MDDPILNCLLAVCCPPEARQAAMTKWLSQYMPAEHAETAAKHILAHFDLAPAGSLTSLVKEITRLARGAEYKE